MSAANRADKPLSYASSGVDIDRESSSVQALISALGRRASTRPQGTFGALVDHAGGFSGLIEFGDRLLALCTDGVGSKLLLAAELDYYETVAIDCMAMNVNDLLCIGAEPLAFVDYIAAPKPAPETWAAIGRSLAVACEQARVSLCGGETATLPDMVNEIDLSGTALGWLPRGMQIDGRAVTSGDSLIGLPASGVHSNGYSLVRKVVEKSGLSLRDHAPFEVANTRAGGSVWRHGSQQGDGVTLGEVLLNPTQIYVDPVVELLKACRDGEGPCRYEDLHGIAHITGGGLSNLLRLRKGAGFSVEHGLAVLPEFVWMQEVGNLSDYEMYRTFNMGMGMCLVVERGTAGDVERWLAERLPGCKIVGSVDDSGVVRHRSTGVVFDSY